MWETKSSRGGGGDMWSWKPVRNMVKLWPLELGVEVVRVYLRFSHHTHVRCRLEQNLYSAQVGVGVKIDNTKNVKMSFNICNYYNLIFSIEIIIIISSSLLFSWISLSFIPNHLLVTTELYYRVNKNGNMGGNVVTWVTCRLICQVMAI